MGFVASHTSEQGQTNKINFKMFMFPVVYFKDVCPLETDNDSGMVFEILLHYNFMKGKVHTIKNAKQKK
jgi:hypothetical protein